jgi:hypothetical protein
MGLTAKSIIIFLKLRNEHENGIALLVVVLLLLAYMTLKNAFSTRLDPEMGLTAKSIIIFKAQK